jgi:hypothetical protein
MALDPEQFITLTRLRLAESACGSIARNDVAALNASGRQASARANPAILNFEPIKNLS